VTADLHAFRALLARRWPVIVPAVVLVPVLTLLLALGQSKVYSAQAQVLLTYNDPGASVNGVAPSYPSTAPDRNVATQAALARNPAVAQQAVKLARVNMTATALLHESSVTTSSTADLVTFAVDDSPPQRAMALATAYARAYTMYRGRIALQTVNSSLSGINRRLQALTAAGQTGTPTYRFLSHDQEELSAIQAAGTNDAVVVQRAQSASVTGPGPARSAALGLGLGIALAAALAFLMETLDKRASVEEIGQRLRLPNLAMIPDTSRWRRLREPLSANAERWRASSLGARTAADGELVSLMGESRSVQRLRATDTRVPRKPTVGELGAEALAVVRDPYGRTADAYRVLKSSLEFARLEHDFKSLLFTSACRPERSETVANLAVTLVQAGRRVLVCDLHAHRGSTTELFRLQDCPGVTDVAFGKASLEGSIVNVSASSLYPASHLGNEDLPGGTRLNGFPSAGDVRGHLGVLPFGGPAPHSGFLGTRAVMDLVEELGRAQADLVLIDAPPLLVSGDAQMLSAIADALVVILSDPVRPSALTDVAVTLSRLPALTLGFVTVGVARKASEGDDHGAPDVDGPAFGEIKRIDGAASTGNGHVAAPAPVDLTAAMASAPQTVGAGVRVDAPAPAPAPVDAPAPVASTPERLAASESRLSVAPPSVPSDLWRVFSGLCAIVGESAVERLPRAGLITREISRKAAHELRRSLQPRIETWSTLATLLR
jgi:Mrp family chromosome partitioning ATPase/capsular polysaccharide biosynthesis protein